MQKPKRMLKIVALAIAILALAHFLAYGKLTADLFNLTVIAVDVLFLLLSAAIWVKTDFFVTRRERLILSTATIFLCLAFLEGFLHFFLIHPGLAEKTGDPFRRLIRLAYMRERKTIQYLPGCSQYDDELSYIGRPGECIFSNIEFNNKVLINHVGVRDSESALERPEVIVLGDSVSMGWGVEQGEAFPKLIEKTARVKTINASVSSYGTVREMKLLDRIDSSNARYLIISYCTNDCFENKYFYDHGDLKPMKSEDYDRLVKQTAADAPYFIGKHLISILKSVAEKIDVSLGSKREEIVLPESEVKYFLNAVTKAGKTDISKFQLVVVTGICTNNGYARLLTQEIQDGDYPEFLKKAIILNFSRMQKDKFYIFDDHMNKLGHEYVAGEIVKSLHLASSK